MSTFGPYAEPAVCLAYGESSTGKSADMQRAFAGRCFYIGPPGGLKSAHNLIGYAIDPKHHLKCETLEDAIRAIRVVGSHPSTKGKFIAAVVDDLSILAARSFHLSAERFPPNKTFARWEYIKSLLSDFTSAARFCGLYLGANAHLGLPGTDSQGRFVRGGPIMPSKGLQVEVTHLFDLAVRTTMLPESPLRWKIGYHCENADSTWAEKDRHHVIHGGVAPQNIGEILRLAGYPLPRAPGLEWQEAVVDAFAKRLRDGEAIDALAAKTVDMLTGKAPRTAIAWTVYDGWSRYFLRYHAADDNTAFVNTLLGGSDGGSIGL